MSRFEGKSVIVTGSSGGIGRAAALRFAKEGAKVALADVKEDDNAETLEMIRSAGGTAMALNIDVSDEAQVKEMVSKTVQEFGGLDVGVNNAGIFQHIALLHEQEDAEFQKVMSVNLRGVWLCMKYQLEQMVSQKCGAIINTTSFSATNAPHGAAFYCASKHGVLGLTRAAGIEYAPMGIRVNAVGPGSTLTPMMTDQFKDNPEFAEQVVKASGDSVPIQRVADPDELAGAILFLASDDASYVVGHNLMVDGGMSID